MRRMLASLAVVAALVLLASSSWQAQAAPGDSCGIGDVTTYGADGSDIDDDTAAIQAAIAASGSNPICFPAGAFYFSSTLTHTPGYVGAGRESTTLMYTGSGTALSSPTPGARTYNSRLEHLRLDSSGSGALGLDMPCVSVAHVNDVWTRHFATGLKISCATDGGSLYNVFTDFTVMDATTAIRITGLSSNENKFFACRVNVSVTAVVIDGGNRNVFQGCAFESGTNGVDIVNNDSDRNQVISSRFENLTGYSVRVAGGVRGTVLAWNDIVAATTSPFQANGTDTTVLDNQPGGATTQLERTALGSGPLLSLKDAASSGNPTTLQIEVPRYTGTALQITRHTDGMDLLRVNGDGAVRPRVDTALPLPSASSAGAGALLVYDSSTAAPRLVISDGTAWRYVDGGALVS